MYGRLTCSSGAAWGIGRATARFLLKKDYNVFVTDLQQNALAACAAEMKKVLSEEQYYSRLAFAPMDVTSDESVKVAIEQCIEKFGRLDVLVNSEFLSI